MRWCCSLACRKRRLTTAAQATCTAAAGWRQQQDNRPRSREAGGPDAPPDPADDEAGRAGADCFMGSGTPGPHTLKGAASSAWSAGQILPRHRGAACVLRPLTAATACHQRRRLAAEATRFDGITPELLRRYVLLNAVLNSENCSGDMTVAQNFAGEAGQHARRGIQGCVCQLTKLTALPMI